MANLDDADRDVARARALRAAEANRRGKARRVIDWDSAISRLKTTLDELESGGQRR